MDSPRTASPVGASPGMAPPNPAGAAPGAQPTAPTAAPGFALRIGELLRARSRATIAVLAVSQRARTITGFGFIIAGLLASIASMTMEGSAAELTGRFGILSTRMLFGLFGKAAFLFGPALIWSGFRGLARDDWSAYLSGLLGNLSVAWSLAVFFRLTGPTPAGIAGEYLAALLDFFTGRTGANLINGLFMFTGVLLLLQIPFEDVKQKIVAFLEGPSAASSEKTNASGNAGSPSRLWLLLPLLPLAYAFWQRFRSRPDAHASAAASVSPQPSVLPLSSETAIPSGGNPVLDRFKPAMADVPPWIQRVELGGSADTTVSDVSRAVDTEIQKSVCVAQATDQAPQGTVPISHVTGDIWRPETGFCDGGDGPLPVCESGNGRADPEEHGGLIIDEEEFPFPGKGSRSDAPSRRNPTIIYDPALNRYLFRRTDEPVSARRSSVPVRDYLDSMDIHLPHGGLATVAAAPAFDHAVEHALDHEDELPRVDNAPFFAGAADRQVREEFEQEFEEGFEEEPGEEFENLDNPTAEAIMPKKEERAALIARPVPASPAMLFPVVLSEERFSRYRLSRRGAKQTQRVESEDPEAEIRENQEKLERVMTDFGVQAKVVGAVRGPMITLYEVRPEAGVRVNRFLGIQDEIRMNLAALSVRVVAPIPGRSTIGVELPNRNRQFVSMGDLVNGDPDFSSGKRELSIALGKDIQGVNRYLDLARLPHILIAGATGSGKSVFMNSVIASLLFNHSPDEVRFLMIDPKMVELKLYEGIPHLLYPVITDVRLAGRALNWAVQEMESRYQLLSNVKCRDLRSYNERIRAGDLQGPPMPYIVVLIDELSDLMMVSAKEVEDSIIRLTQKARAVGIHVIMATQRPSVDVITSLIKANCPARISFQVSQKIDSRIILDMNGAESLLGKGDMLYKSPTAAELVRIQSPMISEQEIEEIVQEACRHGAPRYIDLPAREEEGGGLEDSGDVDQALVDSAWEIIEETGKTSTSYVQRRLRIGYNRAATIIERLEQMGYLGPAIGNRPREILKRH